MIIKKIFTTVCAIGVFASVALSQTGYSESTPYKPRPLIKSEKEKKSEKKNSGSAATPAVVSGSEIVTIPVSVFDSKGGFISGLTKADVNIFVDGVEVPVLTFEKGSEPMNVILVLDTSPSAALRFKTMQEQAWKLVQALPSNANVMVIDFNSEMNVRSKLTASRADVQAAISKSKMGDGTSLYSAIRTLYQKVLPTVPGRKAILLMTDGVDTTSTSSTFANSLAEVEKGDVSIYPVYFDTFKDQMKPAYDRFDPIAEWLMRQRAGIGGPGGLEREKVYKTGLVYINDLAAASGGRIFSSEKLEAGTRSLIEELSSKYYATIAVPKNGAGNRQLRVRINRPRLAVFARGSFIDQ